MSLKSLLDDISQCTYCSEFLPLGPNPVVQASSGSKLLIVGQAPGIRVHNTGIPFNDPSGDRLRNWLGIDKEIFYDTSKIAILPMGFCYPGTGKSGDLPPRPECAVMWRDKLHRHLKNVELTLLIGKYAHDHYLKGNQKSSLTETVRAYEEYLPQGYFPLVHPSPRNQVWHKRNSWFGEEVIPVLRNKIAALL